MHFNFLKRTGSFMIIVVLICISLLGCGKKEITGDEWLLRQREFIPDLEAFVNDMDEVYTLYVMGSISPEDFNQEVLILREEYAIIDAIYTQAKEESPITPGDYSVIAQKGVEGVEKIRSSIVGILTNTYNTDGTLKTTEDVAYMYLSYQEDINNGTASYIVAYQWVSVMLSSKKDNKETEDDK